ncbi:MAG: hypothetical protein F4233_06685 [Rhodospirillaceae bacterium]|nr:hypothetical protein [Rhodospirillaceae bacterium]
MGALFAGRPQAACKERGGARTDAGPARRCSGGIHGRRSHRGRHGHGHPHRPGPRHPGVQPGSDDSARGVRAPGRDPPRRPFAVEQERSACRARVREGWRERLSRRMPGALTAEISHARIRP